MLEQRQRGTGGMEPQHGGTLVPGEAPPASSSPGSVPPPEAGSAGWLEPCSGIHPAGPSSDVIHLPYFRCWQWEGISWAL